MKKEVDISNLRHSLAHLLGAAVLDLYPDAKNTIGPSIENGFYYDFDFTVPIGEADLAKIEERMREILPSWEVFKEIEVTSEEAKEIFSDNPYKIELINEHASDGKKITLYYSGPKKHIPSKESLLKAKSCQLKAGFLDLCRGGHVKSAKLINPKGFKLSRIAGAYWRGDEKNKMLTRIYGLAFETKEELEAYIKQQEEAEKRDHRELGKKLEIFTTADEVGAGLILWLPNGTIIRQELQKWAEETERKWGYQHVSTPHITKSKLYEISGHLPYYKDDLYSPLEIEGEDYYLKPMNCPHTHMIYKHKSRSYKDLPIRFAEYGQVYRYERSGTLHGLMRVRGFCQNDAHLYVTPQQAVDEFIQVLKMHEYYYNALGIKDWWVVLGVRDPKNLREKYHGDDEMWNEAERLTREALEKSGVKYEVEEGGAAHYGPKADIYIKSVIGKEYAIGTDQLDLYMPKRFNLTYIDKDGKEKMPYIIHRAPLGSHERMIGFLLEHYAGAFPLWLSPVQVKVLPIGEDHQKFAKQIFEALQEANIRAEIDDSNETLGKKVRNAKVEKVSYWLVIGNREVEGKVVKVESRDGRDLGQVSISDLILKLKEEILLKK